MDQSMNPPQQPVTPMPQQPMPPAPSGGRISRGFHLLGLSWKVVMAEKSLLWLPLISIAASMLLFGGLTGLLWANGTVDIVSKSTSAGVSAESVASKVPVISYVFIALYYFLAAFVTVYFNAAIIAIAMKRLNGEDPKLGDGFRAANGHLGKIAGWALLTATVGLILRSLQERLGFLGDIIVGLIGAAWTIITFFVVPVLLFEENVGVFGSVKRSASLFKQRWGEQLTGTIGITFLFVIAGAVVVVAGVALTTIAPLIGIPLIVIAVVVMVALSGAVQGVFNAVLYRYATTGEAAAGFTEADLNGVFYSRKNRKR